MENGKIFLGLGINVEGDVQFYMIIDEVGEYLLIEFVLEVIYCFIVDMMMVNLVNGVFILDVIFLVCYILNINFISFFYKIIVGDVNNLGSLIILDIVLICLMIIGELEVFFGGMFSWCFVFSDYIFFLGMILFDLLFCEYCLLNDFSGFNQVDFVVIKMGDINCSVVMFQLIVVKVIFGLVIIYK